MTFQTPSHGFRTFVILWITQSLSVFGTALTFFAINIWIVQVLYPSPEQKAALAFALTAVSLAFALPTILIAPFAGAWADRHDRKRTMMLADTANGGVSLLLLLLILTRSLDLWSLVALSALSAITNIFHTSAFDTSYAMLVPDELLPRANGMMQTIFSLSAIFSPPLAAVIIGLPALARQGVLPAPVGAALSGIADGTALAIALDVCTFVLAVAVLSRLHVPSPSRADRSAADGTLSQSMWADIKEGALFIWRRRPMLWLLSTFTVANFVGAPLGVLEPLLLRFTLIGDYTARGFTYESALALLGSAAGVGGVAGGFLMSTWGGLRRRRVYGVLVPMIVTGVAMLVLGLSPWLYLTAAMAALNAGMIPILNGHSQSVWQSQTPRELQGRVFAVRRVIAQCTWPLSTAIAGLAGALFSPGTVLAVLGIILIVFCTAQLRNPALLRVEDREYLDDLASRAAVNRV